MAAETVFQFICSCLTCVTIWCWSTPIAGDVDSVATLKNMMLNRELLEFGHEKHLYQAKIEERVGLRGRSPLDFTLEDLRRGMGLNFYFDLGGPESDDELLFFRTDPRLDGRFRADDVLAATTFDEAVKTMPPATQWQPLEPGIPLRKYFESGSLTTTQIQNEVEILLFSCTKESYCKALDGKAGLCMESPYTYVFLRFLSNWAVALLPEDAALALTAVLLAVPILSIVLYIIKKRTTATEAEQLATEIVEGVEEAAVSEPEPAPVIQESEDSPNSSGTKDGEWVSISEKEKKETKTEKEKEKEKEKEEESKEEEYDNEAAEYVSEDVADTRHEEAPADEDKDEEVEQAEEADEAVEKEDQYLMRCT